MRTTKNSIEMRGWNHVQEIQSSVQALAALVFSFSRMSSKYRDKFDMLHLVDTQSATAIR